MKFKFDHQFFLQAAIWFAISMVLDSVNITFLTWQYWAIFVLLLGMFVSISMSEFDRHFRDFTKANLDLMNALQEVNQIIKNVTPPSSAPSVPEGTSQQDCKPSIKRD